jgi:hypothetical protein
MNERDARGECFLCFTRGDVATRAHKPMSPNTIVGADL